MSRISTAVRNHRDTAKTRREVSRAIDKRSHQASARAADDGAGPGPAAALTSATGSDRQQVSIGGRTMCTEDFVQKRVTLKGPRRYAHMTPDSCRTPDLAAVRGHFCLRATVGAGRYARPMSEALLAIQMLHDRILIKIAGGLANAPPGPGS